MSMDLMNTNDAFLNTSFGQEIEKEYITSVDMNSEDGAITLLTMSENEPDHKLSDFIGKQITFIDFYMEKTRIEDSVRKGKEIDAIRTVLMMPNGELISGTSSGLAKSVLMIVKCLGYPSVWEREYWFEVKQVETRHARRYFKLQLVREED